MCLFKLNVYKLSINFEIRENLKCLKNMRPVHLNKSNRENKKKEVSIERSKEIVRKYYYIFTINHV